MQNSFIVNFRSIFDSSSEFIGLLNTEGVLLEANKTSLEFINAEAKDVLGKYFWQTPWWNHLENAQRKLKQAVKKAAQGEFVHLETEHRDKNGKIKTIEFSLKPIFNTEGHVELIIPEGRDITDRKRIDELKKEFLSLAAHELKTPITTLKLISQAHIAKYKKYGSDQIKLEELELIDYELERLTQLINDILDDTRVESGKLFLKFEEISLNKLLSSVVRKMNIIAKKQRIKLQKFPDEILVFADQQRIEQVLVNLLSNALKYSNNHTKIEVGAKLDKGKVLVWVSDQGLGIPKSQQQKIFNRFYQVEEKKSRGFGLGLYITKQILKLHKGKIWVKSREGEGSTFYFKLPFRKSNF